MRVSPTNPTTNNLKSSMLSRLGGTGLLSQVHAWSWSVANSGTLSLHSRPLHISRKHQLLPFVSLAFQVPLPFYWISGRRGRSSRTRGWGWWNEVLLLRRVMYKSLGSLTRRLIVISRFGQDGNSERWRLWIPNPCIVQPSPSPLQSLQLYLLVQHCALPLSTRR